MRRLGLLTCSRSIRGPGGDGLAVERPVELWNGMWPERCAAFERGVCLTSVVVLVSLLLRYMLIPSSQTSDTASSSVVHSKPSFVFDNTGQPAAHPPLLLILGRSSVLS